MEMMVEIRKLSFRGIPYRIVAFPERHPQDPSWFSFVDEADVRERDWNVSAGDVVLDIGSAYGSYTLTALAAGASSAHCWNPDSEENESLMLSLAENGWEGKVKIQEVGLHSKTGFLRDVDQAFLEDVGGEVRSYGKAGSFRSSEPSGGFFRVIALDDHELGEARIDWMKIDVEGAEVEVLRGAKKTIGRYKPKVLIENHQFIDPGLAVKVGEVMGSLGYRHVSTHPHHSVSHSLYHPK